ncbi:MAG TPA: hypothetical protein VNI61_00685, partial [Gemmatimonadales bacterium]|nr:hypothetical protein [Gemmatimonadales bacterium]
KYGGLWRVARDLADAMARLLPPPDRDSLLVPVPLGPRRWRERGYNQSGALAQALGRCWEVPVAHGLRRVRETASQTALTPTARLANVAGAFALAPDGLTPGRSPGVSPSSSLLILVDDVFTTGATLAECARALGRAGATRIAAVTFGRAAIPDFS